MNIEALSHRITWAFRPWADHQISVQAQNGRYRELPSTRFGGQRFNVLSIQCFRESRNHRAVLPRFQTASEARRLSFDDSIPTAGSRAGLPEDRRIAACQVNTRTSLQTTLDGVSKPTNDLLAVPSPRVVSRLLNVRPGVGSI